MTSSGFWLVVGMGCRRDVALADLRTHLWAVLTAHALDPEAVRALVTVDTKAEEPGLRALAAELAVPLRTHPPAVLDAQEVTGPSPAAALAVGTRSVAEACVLADGAELIVPKDVGRASTVAIGRIAHDHGRNR